MKLYLGRSRNGYYELAKINDFNIDEGFLLGFIARFCTRTFQKITGIKFKIGEVREVTSIKIKLRKPEGN